MIAESIALFARRTPQKLAIVDPYGREWTYLELDTILSNLVYELVGAIPGLQHHRLVAVSVADRRWQLLLMLALEAVGVAQITFENLSDVALARTLVHCDLVLVSDPVPTSGVRQFVVGQDLIERVSQAGARSVTFTRFLPRQVAIVLTTSGSTGAAKCVPLTWAAVEARDHNRIWQYGLSATAHLMVALPVGVTGILFTLRGALRCGAALDFSQKTDPLPALARTTHTILLPVHIRQLLGVVPADFRPSRKLKLFVLGARLSMPLKLAAMERFNAEVYNVYGSNEAGACAWIGEDDTATVLAGVDVQVVGPDGQVIPQGGTGQLCIRSQEMANRYLDAELTADRFIDGWFQSGDLASVIGQGQWRLLGRLDTMVNLGGIKHSSEEIEDRLAARGLARDLAVAAIADADGIEELYIGLEAAAHSDPDLIALIDDTLGRAIGNIHIVHLDVIPRSSHGKLQRAELVQMLRSEIVRHG